VTNRFTPHSLIQFEKQCGCVQATCAPAGWSGLRVRTGWRPTTIGEGVNLEIQVSATTVGELDHVGLEVMSHHGSRSGGHHREPVDVAARGGVPPPTLTNLGLVVPAGTPPGCFYFEMVWPGDIAPPAELKLRHDESMTKHRRSTRISLFSHELEKGVILLARVRGDWINSSEPARAAVASYKDLLDEPPLLSP
jgi:hypothetical protein